MGVTYPLGRTRDSRGTPWFVADPSAAAGGKLKLLDHLREVMRVRQLRPPTEEPYRRWIERSLFRHHLHHRA